MGGKERDNFKKNEIIDLARRAGYHCSKCGRLTISPTSTETGSIYIGQAAHITAASPRGTRYDSSITSNERKNITNGIFLCSNCHAEIDQDPSKYTPDQLRLMRKNAEERTRKEYERSQGGFENLNENIIINTKSFSDNHKDINIQKLSRDISPEDMSALIRILKKCRTDPTTINTLKEILESMIP